MGKENGLDHMMHVFDSHPQSNARGIVAVFHIIKYAFLGWRFISSVAHDVHYSFPSLLCSARFDHDVMTLRQFFIAHSEFFKNVTDTKNKDSIPRFPDASTSWLA
jgi:hypothetical protein